MFEFLFPASMVAGGILVSSPIIIHLINRMRFKRIRWAAMEFLLKSQKRSRRRLIIEQLILLLLRILLVLLAALLVARWVGGFFGRVQAQTTQHVILLEDTPSMADRWQDGAEKKDSFKEAKRLIVDEIAGNALKASKAQSLKLLTVTQPDQVRESIDRLNEETKQQLQARLALIEPSALHAPLLPGVQQARKLLDEHPQDQRILYIVGDFRSTDWTGPNGDKLMDELVDMRKAGMNVKFVDVVDPVRKESEKDARYHENVAIAQVRPEARVTARNRLTEFVATVVNYSLVERKDMQLKIKVNGQERAEADVPVPPLRPNERTEIKFHVFLDQPGINQVTAALSPEEPTGLAIDNARHAVVEVRERVPILLIDGDAAASVKEGGDSFFLGLMFNEKRGVVSGFDLVSGVPADLERPNLDQFPTVYLVNVRELNDKALAGLEKYVKEGGNVAFFMGDRVNAEFYNRKLYNNGAGVFPVPLADRPTAELTQEERDTRLIRNLQDPQNQILVRNAEQPIFAGVWHENLRSIFNFLNIDRYFPVPRSRWKAVPGVTEEVVTLPSRQSVDDYKEQVQELLAKLNTVTQNDKYKKYQGRFNAYHDAIREILNGRPLHRLGTTIENMLIDRGVEGNAERPNLAEFWNSGDPAVEDLRQKFTQLRQTVQHGDPLVVTGKYGKGRTLVWLTSIGRKWSNWAGDFPVSATFPPVMYELQRWLTSGTGEVDLVVGTPLTITLDANRYEDRMGRIQKKEKGPDGKGGDVVMGEQPGKTEGGKTTFTFADAKEPGVYVLEFKQRAKDGVEAKREQIGYAFNVDTAAESNLARNDRAALMDKVKGAQFYTLASDNWTELEQRQRDLSEGPWLFLLFLLILVLEQAMAVRLSHHLQGSQNTAPLPVAAGGVPTAPV